MFRKIERHEVAILIFILLLIVFLLVISSTTTCNQFEQSGSYHIVNNANGTPIVTNIPIFKCIDR